MNFVDTAAVLSNCDLIITNDSCIVHMAGAMGIKTALLLITYQNGWGRRKQMPGMNQW